MNQETIFIVDDAPANLDVLFKYLERAGFKVLADTNGETAIETIRQAQPDLILLDVMMPGIDGFETCHRLKANEATKNIPVLFMTVVTETEEKVKGFELGAVDYITKPFQIDEVLARINAHLTIRRLQESLHEQNNHLQQEVAERKQAGERTLKIWRRLEFLLNVSPAGIYACNPEGNFDITFISENVQKILGYEPYDFLESPNFWVDHIHPDDKEHVLTGKGIVFETGHHTQEYRFLHQDGTYRWVRDELILMRDNNGHPVEMIGSLSDFTERKQAEIELLAAHNELKEKNAQLHELNASKDKFFSIISHDLRSPLTTLLGFTQMLSTRLKHYSLEQIKHNVDRIRTSAEILYALLENLLTWSRIQRGAMQCEPEAIDLFKNTTENMTIFTPKAEHKGITLRSSIQKNTLAYADYSMVNTILRNLLSNALNFTDSGGSVSISATPQEQYIEIAVSDTGRGIGADNLSQLFRIDTHYTRIGTAGEQGTGLGLILCRELVEKNGGRIWVESELGKGSTFRFILPRMPVE